MKKLLYAFLFLLPISGYAMEKPGKDDFYNPFNKLPQSNYPRLKEADIILILKKGNYDDLERELARGLNAEHVIQSGEYKGKTLIQVAWLASVSNRQEIVSRLLRHGAQVKDLNQFLKLAIDAHNPNQVKWLIDHGAKDDSAYEYAKKLQADEKSQFKKEKLQEIVVLLAPRQTLITPIMKRRSTIAAQPVVQELSVAEQTCATD